MNKIIFRVNNIMNTIGIGYNAIINHSKSKLITNLSLYEINCGNKKYTKNNKRK